ncbi:MAG: hypothetical protein VB094_05190 [Oscillibacter sp.]|nr:hypothetical protein [Oscillibacter sp.]
MDSTKKSALSEFSRRAMQRLQDKKIPKYRLLHIPSLDTDIKIRSLTYEEIRECTEIEDSDRADKYSVYLSVVEPDLRKTAKEVMEAEAELPADQRSLKEALDIVSIFEMSEQTDIALQIMELSGVMNTPKVTVVEQLKN